METKTMVVGNLENGKASNSWLGAYSSSCVKSQREGVVETCKVEDWDVQGQWPQNLCVIIYQLL